MKSKAEKSAYARRWLARNKDRVNAKRRKRYAEDPERRAKILAACKEYRSENSEAYRQQQRQKYERHGHKYRERLREQYADNPDPVLERNARWRKENAEKVAADKIKWAAMDRQKFPQKYRAKCALERAERLKRYADWANVDALNFFYECCPDGCEVDHVIPLRGEIISGLHVETNLQWLTVHQNRVKNNRWTG